MAGNFFHTAHPHTLTDMRLILLTQTDIFWEKMFRATNILDLDLWLSYVRMYNVLHASTVDVTVRIGHHRQFYILLPYFNFRFGLETLSTPSLLSQEVTRRFQNVSGVENN